LALRTRIATGVPLIGDGCAPSSVGAVDYLRGVGRAHVERPRSMADARRELNNFGLTEGIEWRSGIRPEQRRRVGSRMLRRLSLRWAGQDGRRGGHDAPRT